MSTDLGRSCISAGLPGPRGSRPDITGWRSAWEPADCPRPVPGGAVPFIIQTASQIGSLMFPTSEQQAFPRLPDPPGLFGVLQTSYWLQEGRCSPARSSEIALSPGPGGTGPGNSPARGQPGQGTAQPGDSLAREQPGQGTVWPENSPARALAREVGSGSRGERFGKSSYMSPLTGWSTHSHQEWCTLTRSRSHSLRPTLLVPAELRPQTARATLPGGRGDSLQRLTPRPCSEGGIDPVWTVLRGSVGGAGG